MPLRQDIFLFVQIYYSWIVSFFRGVFVFLHWGRETSGDTWFGFDPFCVTKPSLVAARMTPPPRSWFPSPRCIILQNCGAQNVRFPCKFNPHVRLGGRMLHDMIFQAYLATSRYPVKRPRYRCRSPGSCLFIGWGCFFPPRSSPLNFFLDQNALADEEGPGLLEYSCNIPRFRGCVTLRNPET